MLLALLLAFYILFPPEIYNPHFSIFFFTSALFFIAYLHKQLFVKNSLCIIVGVLFALLAMHSFFAQPLNITYELLFITYVIYIALLSNQMESSWSSSLIKGLIFLVLLTGIFALYQYFYGYAADYLKWLPYKDDIFIGKTLGYLKTRRVTSTFALPTVFAGFLVTALPLLVLAIKTFHRATKILAVLAAGICIIASFLTQSHFLVPAFVIILLTGILAGFVSLKRPVFYFVVCIIIIGASFPFIMRKDYSKNLLNSPSVSMRIGNWMIALHMMKEHIVWGVGAGNFHIYYPHYMTSGDIETKYAHNAILQIGAETGIVGFIAILFGYILLLQKIIYAYKSKKVTLTYWAYSSASLLFLAYSLIDISLYFPSIGFFGILCISLFIHEHNNLFPKKSSGLKEITRPIKIIFFIFISIYIIISASLYYYESFLQKAYIELKSGDTAHSFVDAQNYIRYFPYDLSPGYLLTDLSTHVPTIENKLMIYEKIKTDFPESASMHSMIASGYLQNQLFFDAYTHYCISPLLYPSKPLYTDACRKSSEIINNLNERYSTENPF